MMRLLKMLGTALVAVLVFNSATAVGISAHSFEASKSPLLLLAKQSGLFTFTFPAATVTCETQKGIGTAGTLAALSLILTLSYTNCSATVGAVKGTVNEPIIVEFEYSADGNHHRFVTPVQIQLTLAGIKCSIGIPAQGPLTSDTYDNQAGGKILLLSNVSGISTSAKGFGCKEEYTSSKTGTGVGNSVVEGDSGEIKWT